MNQFKWNAEEYARNSETQHKWAAELIEMLDLKGDESLLDIGCGDGKITAEIAKKTSRGNVVGIDSSQEMINLAKDKFPKVDYPNLSFETIDARNISFRNKFDVVFSNAALHWVKEQDKVVEGIAACLKPNGKILLQMGGEGNAKDILSCLDEIINNKHWKNYFSDFNFSYSFLGIEEYKKLLKKSGLVEKHVELIPKDMQQKGKEDLAGWIRTTWLPYLEKIPEDGLRERFISELVDNYIDKFPIDTAGIIHVKMVRLQVSAVKA